LQIIPNYSAFFDEQRPVNGEISPMQLLAQTSMKGGDLTAEMYLKSKILLEDSLHRTQTQEISEALKILWAQAPVDR